MQDHSICFDHPVSTCNKKTAQFAMCWPWLNLDAGVGVFLEPSNTKFRNEDLQKEKLFFQWYECWIAKYYIQLHGSGDLETLITTTNILHQSANGAHVSRMSLPKNVMHSPANDWSMFGGISKFLMKVFMYGIAVRSSAIPASLRCFQKKGWPCKGIYENGCYQSCDKVFDISLLISSSPISISLNSVHWLYNRSI